MANSFIKKGINVVIYSLHRTNKQPLYKVSDGVKIIYLSTFSFKDGFYKFTTFYSCLKLRLMNAKLSEPQIENISTHPITTIYLKALGFNMANIIASEHSTYDSHGKLICKLREWAYSKVKKIITQTKSGHFSFSEINLDTTTIYNSTVNFNDTDQWNLNKSDAFVCLTVARIEPVKNLELFLKIAREFKDKDVKIKFVIVGDGSQKAYLEDKSKAMGLSSLVEFHPATNEVNKFYKNASLYLITSKSESFSMTMTEALSFSVPVVSNKGLVGPSEVLTHNYDGFLCNDNDIEDFTNCIMAAYDEACLSKLRKNALKTAKMFHEDVIVEQWLKVL
ncbi:glycosyltransferase [Pseudoalteromonas phenolica O-BC30]|nr:glycosyltransferase [Pseudoalteromonas phenolica O-BC30]